MSKRVYGLFTLLLVASVLLTACGGAAPTTAPATKAPAATTAPAETGKTIKIATQSPLSGGSAAVGEGIKNGTQLAI